MIRPPIPSLNWLRVFEATARLGSLSAAGRELHMTPSAVSQQIKALEAHLNTVLFLRTSRALRLTDAATSFMPTVQKALTSVEQAADSLFASEANPILTLQVAPIFANGWLASRLPEFQERYPHIRLNMKGDYREEDRDRRQADLIIHFGAAPRFWGVSEPLIKENIVPVIREDQAERIQAPEDILAFQLVDIPSHKINWTTFLGQHSLVPEARMRFLQVESTDMALPIAAQGQSIALAREPISDGLASLYNLVHCPLFDAISESEQYYLLYRSRYTLSQPALLFREWLLGQVSKV